jgi:hypothetical protein
MRRGPDPMTKKSLVVASPMSDQLRRSSTINTEIIIPRSTVTVNDWHAEESQSPDRVRFLNQERPSTYGLVDQVPVVSRSTFDTC